MNLTTEQLLIKDPKIQRWIIYSGAFAAFMCTLDNNIVNISLPTISVYFHSGINDVSWIVISYLLILTSTIPFFGKLGDKIGLIRLFTAGYIVFIAGSLLCGLSFSLPMLIISRCIQALGGAVLFTIPSAIITRNLPPEKRGYSFGILSTAAAVGFAMGAPLGGVITSFVGWQWVFLINIPVGFVAIYIVWRKFPRTGEFITTKQKFDIPGVFYCFFWLVSLMLTLNKGRELGWTSPVIIISFLISLTMLILFIWRENRMKFPLLDLKLFRIKSFTYPNLGNFFVFMAANGANFILPFYLIGVMGMTTDRAGILLMAFPLLNMVMGPVAGKTSDKISPRLLCIIGASLCLAAALIFLFTFHYTGIWPALVFLSLTGFSTGMFLSPNNNQIMSTAPKDVPGMASGILRTLTNLGSVIGVVLFEIMFSKSNDGTSTITISNIKTVSVVSEQHIANGLNYVIILASVLYALALLFSFLTPKNSPHKRNTETEIR